MKQKLLNKFWLRVGMIVAIMTTALSGTVWADEVTSEVDFSSGTFQTDHITWTLDDVITITQAKGTSSNAVNSSYISLPRFYQGHVISFEATSGVTITSIVISGSTGTGSNSISKFGTNAGWTINSTDGTATWSGSASSASITPGAQVRPTGITITYTTSGGSVTPTCAIPTFSPAAGTYYGTQNVTISSTEGATIYYTTNGTNPTTSSSVYSTAIPVSETTTIKAMAVKTDYNNSDVATALYTIKQAVSGYTIDFENGVDAYVDWEMTNIGIRTGIEGVTAHGGSAWGANVNSSSNGVATASIKTKTTVAYPGSFTCYISKESGNTTASTWTLDVSEDGTTWTEVATHAAQSMSKGEWVEFTANLSGYSDVYVRLSYGSSSAIRAIDDISITMRDPNAKKTPVVTIDATGITTTDIAGNANVAAGTLAATVTSGETNITTPAVTWSSSDTGVATINASTGAVTLIAVGTTTITATFVGNDDYTEATDTYELTVINTYAKGQVNNPYTVAEAIDAIDNDGNVTDVYVRGIVCTGGSSLSSGALTYWISDDGTETDKFEIYRGKGISNANFTSTDDIQVGDVVVVRGNITLYNSTTYEFSSGSQLVSLSRKNDSDLAAIGNINLSMASPETTADATAYFTTSSTGAISYESGNTSVATVNAAGVVTPVAAGTTTITVTQAADANYKAGEITINVIVAVASLNSTTIAANASGSTTYGTPKEESYMIDETYDGTIAAVSSNPAVATVAIIQHTAGEGTFTITPVAVGTAVITISAPATATCEAATDVTYTITVNAPAGQTTAAAAAVTLFNETFAGCTSTGGNDTDGWSGQIATGTLTDGTCTDNSGWTFANGNAANGCAKFGSGSKKGSATTPAIGTAGTLILSFKAAAWNGATEGTTLKLSVSEGSIDKSSVTMTKGAFDTFTATITNATVETTITFEAQNASNNRFFLDDVKVTTEGAELTAKLNDSGYATYCSQYPLDFSDYATAGYSAWQITGVSGETITFSQITGRVKGGTGILLKGTAGEPITLTSADSEITLSGNKLYGTLAPTYVAADTYYGLSGNQFVKVNAGTVPAGKALLPASALSSNVKAFTFVFEDDATAIETIDHSPLTIDHSIYNLAGQRLNKMQKGINIVNGKKVMVK